MIKRLGLAFLGVLAANSAFANLYVGAGGGYQHFTAKRYSYTYPGIFVDGPVTTVYEKGTGTTGIGNFFMGYEFRLGERFGFGIETVFQPGKVETKVSRSQTADNTNTTFATDTYTKTLQNSWGFNAKPALYLSDSTKLFATIGWQQARVKTAGGLIGDVALNERANAVVSGFGLEFALPIDGDALDSPLALRAEYAVADYNKLFRFGSMRTHSVLLSLIYKF
jgi:opacity protein-like surface antigen